MTPKEFYAHELEVLHAKWRAGIWPALTDAIVYCHEAEIRLPEWAADAALKIIQDHYHVAKSSEGAGAYASSEGRLRMDYAHYLRWRAVRFALWKHLLTELPNKRGRPGGGLTTKGAILDQAAERLRDRKETKEARLGEEGAADKIEKSFRQVEGSIARGEQRFRFDDLVTL